MKTPLLGALLALLLPGGCATAPQLSVASDAADPRSGRWATLAREVAQTTKNLHSLLIVDHNRPIVELYRNGWDTSMSSGGVLSVWTEEGPEVLHDVRSVTKSVVALLVGTVLARHPEVTVDSPLESLRAIAARLPASARKLTLAQLLGMSTGLGWNEWGRPWWASDESPLWWVDDPIRYTLDRPSVDPPDTRFVYSGGNFQVVAWILETLEGQPLAEIARRDLWMPLGIDRVSWARRRDGEVLAYAGLGLRTRDLARLGELVSARGFYHGREVVPPVWIDRITAPRLATETGLFDLDTDTWYGLGWWTGTVEAGGRVQRWAAGVGNGGQRLFVTPGLIVVMTAGDYGDPAIQRWETDLLRRIVTVDIPGADLVQ